MTIKVSQKGWVVIPAELRKKHGLIPGAEVVIVDYGGVLAIIPAFKDPVTEGYGILRDGPSLTGALLEERGQDGKYERRKSDLYKS